MTKDTAFDMAMLLRQSHCDRDGEDHACVGTMTVKKGEVCLSCPLCGEASQSPGWCVLTDQRLRIVFSAAGIRWDSLDLESRRQAIITCKGLWAAK